MFQSGIALVGLFALALPIAVHLLSRKQARKFPFPSLEFLDDFRSYRFRPRRLQDIPLLLLRLATILFLVFGIAEPRLLLSRLPGRSIVILMDASASMGAMSRAQDAKQHAKSIIAGLQAGETAAIVSFGNSANVLQPPTINHDSLLLAIEKFSPGYGLANFDRGLAKASSLLSSLPGKENAVYLISDFQQSNFDSLRLSGQLPKPTTLAPVGIGQALTVNRFMDSAELSANGTNQNIRSNEVQLTPGARVFSASTFDIANPDRLTARIELHRESGGALFGWVAASSPDDFAIDDRRYFSFNEIKNCNALIVDPSDETGPYLEAAIRSSGIRGDAVSVDRKSSIQDVDDLKRYALIAYSLSGDTTESEVQSLSRYALEGGTVWLHVSSDFNVQTYQNSVERDLELFPFKTLTKLGKPEELSIGDVRTGASVLRGTGENSLREIVGVSVLTDVRADASDSAIPIAVWSDGRPAIFYQGVGRGIVIASAFSLKRTTTKLGLSRSFPLLVSTIFSNISAPNEYSIEAGRPIFTGALPSTPVSIESIDGRKSMTTAGELATGDVPALAIPGNYCLRFDGQTRYVAINVPLVESETAIASQEEIAAAFKALNSVAQVSTASVKDSDKRPWLPIALLIVAFLFSIAEFSYWMIGRSQNAG